MTRDMTTGRPAKMIFHFTLPIFIGNVFQQFYSMADTIIVGKFVGNSALAAVGACGTLMFLILGFLIGMTAGFTVVTAQHYGAGNQTAMRKSVASVRGRIGSFYRIEYADDEERTEMDEHAERYVRAGIRLHHGHMRRNRRAGTVQLAGECFKSCRRQ